MGCCLQYIRLLVVLIKLKSWKLLFSALVIVAVWSNNLFLKPVGSLMLRMGEQDLHMIGAKEFQEENIILIDQDRFPLETTIITNTVTRLSGQDFNSENLQQCSGGPSCQDKYFNLLIRRKDKLIHYIDFQSAADGRAKLQCQLSAGSELYCPFVAYLMGVAQPRDHDPYFQFNETYVFRLKSNISKFGKAPGPKSTVCKSDINFPSIFPKTIMAQMIFTAIALVFYLLVCTVSCIYELKRTGFLPLMYRRGLSGSAFWFAIWTITLLEMAIFAAVLTVSYNFQCSGFYAASRLIIVFISVFLHFCNSAALVLLFSVITRSFVLTSLLACAYHLAAVMIMVAYRMHFKEGDNMVLKFVLLIVPLGHIAEQVHAELFKDLIPKSENSALSILLPLTCVLLVLLIIAIVYLDFVLKSGNGLHLPHGFLFRPGFWSLSSSDFAKMDEPPESPMVEEPTPGLKPAMCVLSLRKLYRTCQGTTNKALRNFSALFYRDQITAIVGHNGSGKSTLLQILSGDRHPTSGQASFNKILLTDPLCRYHLSRDISYCPQPDALVERLTVKDTLRLTASSASLEWNEVRTDIDAVLSALQIEEKIGDTIYNLSSSDKRKVCITMALVGMPKLILLDNPSRDLDFMSRRRLWSLLHKYKKGRVIIISTLFIDEADGIADRIFFMSGGKIICAGSSFFLKRAFDCRYIIQIASTTEYHVPYIMRRIVAKFNNVRVRSYSNADLELEVSILDDSILPAVILEVESMSELIDEFGIANYSLDDVYSKLKGVPPNLVNDHFQSSTIGYVADDVDRIIAIRSRPPEAPPAGPPVVEWQASIIMTACALMVAHFLQTRRSVVRFVVRAVVPLALLLLVLVGGVFERGMKNTAKTVWHNLGDTANFEKAHGTCIYYQTLSSTPYMEKIMDHDCKRFLSGTDWINATHKMNTTYPNVKAFERMVTRYDFGDFQKVISDADFLQHVAEQCQNAKGPCPIVFSTSWCPCDTPVLKYLVFIGTYVTDDAPYDAINIARTSIEIYKNTFSEIADRYANRIGGSILHTSPGQSLVPDFDTQGIMSINSISFSFYGMFFQLILLAVLPAICLNDAIQDRVTGIRRQLASMSLNRTHYWISIGLCHWIQLAIMYTLSTIILVAVASPAYSDAFFLISVFLPTLTLGLINGLLFCYVVSTFVAHLSYVAVAAYTCFSLLVSLSVIMVQSEDQIAQIMTYVFPHFAIVAPTFFGTKFVHYWLAFFSHPIFSTEHTNGMPNLMLLTFSEFKMRDAIIALVIHFILLLALLIVREMLDSRGGCCKKKHSEELYKYDNCKEGNINEEIRNMEENPKCNRNIMEANQLQVMNKDGQQVVKNLTLGVKHGDITGLVGPCSSGKGSALRAIVCAQPQAAGRVDFQVKDSWLSNTSAVQQGFIGYCPKYDPLFERLTVRENLELYSSSMGTQSERVQHLIKQFQLEGDVNTLIMYSTTGVKRRLSLAIATLTAPRFVAIDQPTACVDPDGKQMIWQSIKSLNGIERGILITIQCMDEAETLCSRICILSNGVMAALSDINELIDKYKRMYFIEIQISDVADESPVDAQLRKEEITNHIKSKFLGAIIIEQLTLRLQFGFPIKSMGLLSDALTWLLELKQNTGILYFTIHYATIDQTMKAIVVYNETQTIKSHEEATPVTV